MTPNNRAGQYRNTLQGYRAFYPAHLPPEPPIVQDQELIYALSDADRALGRLDGTASNLPNPELFVAMYVRQEAVLSSQIEGTQSTLEDVLDYEAGLREGRPKDVPEVFNYVAAMEHGLARLSDLPLSLRLIREIHEKLLSGVRGSERSPGEFRITQNWIGPQGCTLQNATFVPPPPDELMSILGNFETFLNDRSPYPPLLQCGIVHAQFETIHPFLDGNGRVGRLLITLLLCERKILSQPLLYLSHYFRVHRAEYYDRLMAIRNSGDWEGWLKFFLRGIAVVAASASKMAKNIQIMREKHRAYVTSELSSSQHAATLLDMLFEHVVVTVNQINKWLGCSTATANKLVRQFEQLGLLQEITGQKRNRVFRYEPYLSLIHEQGLEVDQMDDVSRQLTGGGIN